MWNPVRVINALSCCADPSEWDGHGVREKPTPVRDWGPEVGAPARACPVASRLWAFGKVLMPGALLVRWGAAPAS